MIERSSMPPHSIAYIAGDQPMIASGRIADDTSRMRARRLAQPPREIFLSLKLQSRNRECHNHASKTRIGALWIFILRRRDPLRSARPAMADAARLAPQYGGLAPLRRAA
jgi:hypothetical protein